MCFEASESYGYVYDRLSTLAERVAVGPPGAMRLIFRSKRKNDRIDAHKLAVLLYLVRVMHAMLGNGEAWRTSAA